MILTRFDRLLIAGLLVTAIVWLGIVRYRSGKTDMVVVQVDGKEVIRSVLAKDDRFSVEGVLGNTEIDIKDGQVRVIDSPCSRKICVQTGWIHKPYQTIICAPNHLVIYLISSDNSDELDGVTR